MLAPGQRVRRSLRWGYNSPTDTMPTAASQMADAQGRDDGLLVDQARPVSSARASASVNRAPIAAMASVGAAVLPGSGRRP